MSAGKAMISSSSERLELSTDFFFAAAFPVLIPSLNKRVNPADP